MLPRLTNPGLQPTQVSVVTVKLFCERNTGDKDGLESSSVISTSSASFIASSVPPELRRLDSEFVSIESIFKALRNHNLQALLRLPMRPQVPRYMKKTSVRRDFRRSRRFPVNPLYDAICSRVPLSHKLFVRL